MMSDVQAADDATTYVTRVIQQIANLQNSSLTLESGASCAGVAVSLTVALCPCAHLATLLIGARLAFVGGFVYVVTLATLTVLRSVTITQVVGDRY